MAGVTKLRIKLGPGGSVKTFHNYPDMRNCSTARRNEQSIGEDINQSKKRGPQELEDVQPNKKQKKLDRDLSSQCCTLLRLLMEHKTGWLFNKPVDPVQLKIPDYFSVITKPMDLGTIKSKLLRSLYSSAEEFAADVRLTFANAMKYNPPDNLVHKVAKELKEIFEVRWESLKKKKIEIREDSRRQPELPKPTKESSQKVCLLSKPVKAQSRQDTSSVAPKALITKLRVKQPDLGNGISSTVKLPSKVPATACRCGSCGMITCTCLKSCNSSGSEVSTLTDCQLMNTPGSQASDSDPHYNGSVSSRNEKNGRVSSQLDIPAKSTLFVNEMKMPFPDMPPLPPEKALRAAKLKAQFAETILKAKHRKVLDQSNNKVDLIKIQIEKEQMERAHREEKARIEAEMRAAKIASQMRAETERKQNREIERLKVEKVKKTVYFEEDALILEHEMVKICGRSNPTRNPLSDLGLFLRKDDESIEEIESDSMRVDEVEEGEIL